jgi:K(+)-stimulated pyrophosphate-energized sodium pump
MRGSELRAWPDGLTLSPFHGDAAGQIRRATEEKVKFDIAIAVGATVVASLVALAYALAKAKWIFRQDKGPESLKRIAGFISEGAQAFLSREYRSLAPFAAVAAAFLALANQGPMRFQAAAFALGATFSALSGWLGMKVATAANSRTAQAATLGLDKALGVSFAGGSVMGMTVVGLSLMGLAIVVGGMTAFFGASAATLSGVVFPVLSGYSLGASAVALFARVGGGIFTKAADVGADLVGKVEAGIPEDDPRNPAVIADNVGDNVGDVAGMGADLFESYVGAIVGCVILGIANPLTSDSGKVALSLLPFAIAGIGVLASVGATFLVRAKPGASPQKALNRGTFAAAIAAAVLIAPVSYFVIGPEPFGGSAFGQGYAWLSIFLSAAIGLGAGIAIGSLTEFFTGTATGPVLKIVKSCDTGPATTIITGLGVGMISTMPPVIAIGGAIWASYALAGLYGIGVAGLGMLVTLGIQLSVDAYGPIADNAGGLAVMSGMPHEVREITDSLDAVGNTTAAIGKGFAIGSAALTAIILFSAFVQAVGGSLDLSILNPMVIIGLFVGGMITFVFSALAMDAIGVSAYAMIEEVRRQFRERPGILDESETPDYRACVDISTRSALRKMVLPGLIAALAPIATGIMGGFEMQAGLLVGATVSGVLLAVFMANSGGAWDNAKKHIEGRADNGKGSDSHKAAVVGDTVGDPFKDTAGPAINILIKLMAIVSLVAVPFIRMIRG